MLDASGVGSHVRIHARYPARGILPELDVGLRAMEDVVAERRKPHIKAKAGELPKEPVIIRYRSHKSHSRMSA
jgi:hypothetical protein